MSRIFSSDLLFLIGSAQAMRLDQYDVVTIGAGQAGIPLSNHLATAGFPVAIVEQKRLSGSCVNFGCTPSKAAIASPRVAHMARRADESGIRVNAVTIDFAKVIERARSIAEASRSSLEKLLADKNNPVLLPGHAQLAGRAGERFLVAIGAIRIVASQIVLNTGTRTQTPEVK